MIRAILKCELNGRAYAPGDEMTGEDARAAIERGWAKAVAVSKSAKETEQK